MTSSSPLLSPAPPSRDTNPFSTCWTRAGALPFRFDGEQNADELIAKFATQNWLGAIIGPHGSGKSTLLETLKPALIAAGKSIRSISLHDGQRRLPAQSRCEFTANGLLIIDGYEQLAWLERIRLLRCCRRAGCGLLVTAHTPVSIPTLIRLAPDRRLVEQLVDELCARVSTDITSTDVDASHACHGSNVREIFSDLYDSHERRRRESNSQPAAS